MKKFLIVLVFPNLLGGYLFAAEAGMPQLDPEYWASQAFWLVIIFLTIYLLLSKIFIPKIKDNIDMRESKIRKDLEEAKIFREEAEKKLKKYKELIENAKKDAKKILSESNQKLNDNMQEKKNKVRKEIEQETSSKKDNNLENEPKNEVTIVTKNENEELMQIIYFDFDKFNLSEVSKDKIKKFLNNYGNVINEYLVVGHTDTKGTNKYNLSLSIKRAEVVKEILINYGIQQSSIKILGKGEESLAVNTPDDTKHPANRRVEIKKTN